MPLGLGNWISYPSYSQDTILALDAAISFNDKAMNSNSGLDRLLDTGTEALKQLRNQRSTLGVRGKCTVVPIDISDFRNNYDIANRISHFRSSRVG